MTKLGILDIGTNSIHLVLAEVEPDFSYKILDRFKDMTRLGDGAFKNRRLSEAAMARALEVIRNLTTLARNKGYDRIVAVATSAVREARNGGEFIEEVARQTGLTVRVVTGQEEARLIYLGVRHSMDLADRPSLVVDVGGGSVELIVGNRKAMVQGQSLKLGAIRLKDLYLRNDPPTKSMLHDLQKAVDAELASALHRFRTKAFDRLVATSGMAGNLTEVIYLRRTGRPVPQLNLATVTFKEVKAVEALLTHASFKDRLAIPGLDPKRADTLLPATIVFRSLMDLTKHRELTISDKAIREGLIYDFIERHREGILAEQEIPNVRRRNVIFLARRCHSPETHTHHVAKLATRLFDETRALHGLDDRAREWLEYAALLHDVGYLINSRQHHKHAYYVIRHSDLAGLTAEDIEMIAGIARYHRRALPHDEHAIFKSKTLTPRHRRMVEMLSALLRIADGLDRSHFSVIQDLDAHIGKPVVVTLHTSGDPELEMWAACKRVDLFERVFKRAVQFTIRPIEGESA
ncbi:MAG TPA: Ppx/GppA phosphatase family protein [Nitrospiraceae bacterium]|nr:Ppx/GppA phosphatase family protein [Nitrospiraceae bacterium]